MKFSLYEACYQRNTSPEDVLPSMLRHFAESRAAEFSAVKDILEHLQIEPNIKAAIKEWDVQRDAICVLYVDIEDAKQATLFRMFTDGEYLEAKISRELY